MAFSIRNAAVTLTFLYYLFHSTTNALPPTTSNSSGEYWIATTDHQFESQSIICQSKNCYILCIAQSSCNSTNITDSLQSSTSSSMVTIQCLSTHSCLGIHINLSTHSLMITALDVDALINGSIFVTGLQSMIHILCSSTNHSACDNLQIHFPPNSNSNFTLDSNSTSSLTNADLSSFSSLYCQHHGCGALDIYIENDMNDIIVDIDSQCSCHSVSDCISWWNIYCDSSIDGNGDEKGDEIGNGHSTFDGTTCNGPCCGDIIEDSYDSFLFYQSVSECNTLDEYDDIDDIEDLNTTGIDEMESTVLNTHSDTTTDALEGEEDPTLLEIVEDVLIIVGGTCCLCAMLCIMFSCLRRANWGLSRENTDERPKAISQYMQDSVSLYRPPKLSEADKDSLLSDSSTALALTEYLGNKSVKPHLQ